MEMTSAGGVWWIPVQGQSVWRFSIVIDEGLGPLTVVFGAESMVRNNVSVGLLGEGSWMRGGGGSESVHAPDRYDRESKSSRGNGGVDGNTAATLAYVGMDSLFVVSVIVYCTVELYSGILHYIISHCMVLYFIVQCCTLFHYTVLFYSLNSEIE